MIHLLRTMFNLHGFEAPLRELGRQNNSITQEQVQELAASTGFPPSYLVRWMLGRPPFQSLVFYTREGDVDEFAALERKAKFQQVFDLADGNTENLILTRFEFEYDATKEPSRLWVGAKTTVKCLLLPLILVSYVLVTIFRKLSPWQRTGATVLLSAVIYAWWWGWYFALGFLGLLCIHEAGHWLVLQRHKLGASPPIFWPGMGALINFKEPPKTAWQESTVGIGGPLVGTFGVLLVALMGPLLGGTLWGPLVTVGLALNIFNMVPVLPLDGGRITSIIHPKVTVGLFVVFGSILLWYMRDALGVILVVFGALELRFLWKQKTSEEYREKSWRRPALMMGLYFALLGVQLYVLAYCHMDTDNTKDLTLISGPAFLALGEVLGRYFERGSWGPSISVHLTPCRVRYSTPSRPPA